MRPLRLDLQGFTVFRDPTTVDFTDADFFALVGPTGAGKSSVLDAICFALYGTVPRWDDRRSIEHALAPSAAEARVRLVFQAGGARFVATRVVRRDSKGRVATTHAGLEQLPAGFDLSTFDTAPGQRGAHALGTVLAGTPTEMDAAVMAAVGLPYEQFTSSVLLPQGEFARFLHAKPKQRQDILVNLLGLHVYRRIAERAGAEQRDAETQAATIRRLLADFSGADDAALGRARQTVAAADELAAAVELELPALVEAGTAGQAAQAHLSTVESELALLSAVAVPAAVASLSDQVAGLAKESESAAAAVLDAEEREEKLRAELAAAGDRAALQRVVQLRTERESLAARVTELAGAVDRATRSHAAAVSTVEKSAAVAERVTATVADALSGIEAAQTADRAATLRVHLVAGQPCPVCEQEVTRVPAMPRSPALTAAKAKHAKAEQAAAEAIAAHQRVDRELRQLDRELAAVTAQHAESERRLAEGDAELAGQPAPAAVQARLKAIVAKERALAAATEEVKLARRRGRDAAAAAKQAQERLRAAWREYDRVRDTVAGFAPPAPDRGDLAGSWQALRRWTLAAGAERETGRDALLEQAQAALAAITALTARLADLFRHAGAQPVVSTVEASAYRQAAALVAERARGALAQVEQRREQAQRLTAEVAELDQAALVAKSLALHLRADRFERWLLAEALDALVADASRILRELSGGQYDLDHDNGEFLVIDHADAGLRRGVRTLSGGETFQASLALALALSEQQLAGLSSASASLESIMLDEGFGTLDSSSLDTVAATLENLASRGDRMVGVVTHVVALAERIPVRYEVSKDARGVAAVERSG